MHRFTGCALGLAVLALAGMASTGTSAQPAPGWTAEFVVRVESAGKRPVDAGPARTAVNGAFEWNSAHELRGTLAYTQRLRGAVARNQPDRNDEQRYESWLARAQRVPVQLTLHSVRSEQWSGRVVAVDGEGAAAINQANAGKIGKTEHVRARTEVKVDGADGARMGGGYLQIDRVANQVRFEVPTVEINPVRALVIEQRVARLGAAAPAGEWDRNETLTPKSSQELRLPSQLPYPAEFVFDVPAALLADAKEIRLTQEFKAGFVDYEIPLSRGVITIVLRRADAVAATVAPTAAAAGAAAAAASPPPAKADAKKTEPAPAQPATPTVQDVAKAVDKLRGLFGR